MPNQATKWAIGGDPELFVTKAGSIIPVCGLIGGTKGAPIRIQSNHPYMWHEDNVSLELNFPPSEQPGMFKRNVDTMMLAVDMALAHRGMSYLIKPVHKFKASELRSDGASKFGCDPDFNAYSDDPEKPRMINYAAIKQNRFCGGHIHLSFKNKENIDTHIVAIILDAILGLPSIIYDTQGERRFLYGQAGTFRPKPYGIEYRTLSPFWLQCEYMEHMAWSALACVKLLDEKPNEMADLFACLPFNDIKTIINQENKKEAMKITPQIRNAIKTTVKSTELETFLSTY